MRPRGLDEARGAVRVPPRARRGVEGARLLEGDELGRAGRVDDVAVGAVPVVAVHDAEDLLLAHGPVVEAEPERHEGRQHGEGELEVVRDALRVRQAAVVDEEVC